MRREKFILYVVPFSMDMVIGVISISIPLFAINLGADALTLGELGFIGPLFYVLLTPVSGRLLDSIGYKYLLLSGSLVYFVASLALSLSSGLYQLFIFMPFVGTAGALFWPSLEVWVAQMRTGDPLTKRIGLFNISWCMGAALGPLVGGMVFQINSHLPFYLAGSLSLSLGLLTLRKLLGNKGEISPENSRKALPEGDPPPTRELSSNSSSRKASLYLYAAWVANFANYFSMGIIRYLFPKLSVQLGIQPSILGILLGSVALFQTLTFYILGKTGRWHYKWAPLLSLQFLGILGLVLVFLGSSVAVFLLSFMLIGIGGGMTYFSSIFYSLNDFKHRGQKSGIHEAILGSGVLFGPLIGGILAQAYTLRTPYLLAIFVMGAAILGEVLLIRDKG